MRVLKNWILSKDGRLFGNIYNSPSHVNGEFISTSKIINLQKDIVTTESSINYKLEESYTHTLEDIEYTGEYVGESLEILVERVKDWADERGLFTSRSILERTTQALKCVEEVGEFAADTVKGRDVRDSIGDILVTLIINAELNNTSLDECLGLAYAEISKRKGKTVNGIFIKESDL